MRERHQNYPAYFLLLIALLALPASIAADTAATPVIEVYTFDVAGDLPGFAALVKQARAVGQKINPDAETSLSIYTALEAGPMSDQVTVAVEHASLSDWGKAAEKISASPEWRAIAARFRESNYKLISRSLHVQVARDQ